MGNFFFSILITIGALVVSTVWAGWEGLFVCALLIVMEVSFSFDNAVVNATVLKGMDRKWQQRFITWGMLIAVFGMYYLFPILIVAIATGLGIIEVTQLALNEPEAYTHHLMESHVEIASFGGMFLLMVFLKFILNEGKELHWLGVIEEKLSRLGKLEAVEIIVALFGLLLLQSLLPEEERLHALEAGVFGVVLYVAVHSLTALMSMGKLTAGASTSGFMGFIYLNILDASFSLDAVIGSFAISRDIVIIMSGLTAGAMFVRSLTIYLVRKGTLDQYVFLEHGAHYGIGALAAIMLVSLVTPVSEIVTGLVGITFIALSLYSSVRYNRRALKGALSKD